MKREADAHLASLTQELRVAIYELNLRLHPVYPGDPQQIQDLETQVAELRSAICQRREQLSYAAAQAALLAQAAQASQAAATVA